MDKIYTKPLDTLETHFYKPLDLALDRATQTRHCKEYSDTMFLRAGVGRIVQAAKSGREWVQLVQTLGVICVSVGNFFEVIKSKRRLRGTSKGHSLPRKKVFGILIGLSISG